MAVSGVSATSTISKIFTKLGNNSGSVLPMYVKDFSSDTLTSMTYFKEGGKRDGIEKTFEEFGTGVLWLGGIPAIKKFVFDNWIYKKKGINPDIDAKRLFSGDDKTVSDTLEYAKEKASSLGSAYKEQADVLQHTVENKSLAKKLALSKFGIATALTGLSLFTLITIKQKMTEKEIEKQVREKYAKESILKNSLKQNEIYQSFKGSDKNPNQPNFTGLGTFLMTNPVANTAIVDCVITGTRLAQARKGEKFEVGLKEGCEIAFIYGLAQPLQKGMEKLTKGLFKKPINLEYSVLDSNVLKEAIDAEKAQKGSSELLKQAKQIVEFGGGETSKKGIAGMIDKVKSIINHTNKMPNESSKKIVDFIFDEKNSQIADVLKRSGDVGTYTTKEGVEQLSLLSSINGNSVKNTAQKTIEIIENAVANGESATKYLKTTKMLKGGAIIANIALSAILIGYLQPKLNLYLRKKLHNGDNTNPAIKNLTQQMENKLMFEGTNKNNN